MKYRVILLVILLIDATVLLFETSQLSISYHEATIVYESKSVLHYIIKFFISLFGQNDFALRLPMLFLHISSVVLLWLISKNYLKNDRNRLWLILIFIFLPGVISSAILVDDAGLVIFLLLLFVYLHDKFNKILLNLLLVIYLPMSENISFLYLSLIFYSLHTKENALLLVNIVLFSASIYIFGFNTEGLPKGHFLDAIGLYVAIFTPIVFLYIFYTLYKKYLTTDTPLVWYISVVPFLLSLILSFRQTINIENFAPYLILALLLSADQFESSYRVRLKQFRKKYLFIFVTSFVFLVSNSLIVFFNKGIYLLVENPKTNFAYKMHVVKELANELRLKDIECVDTNKQYSLRLKFYGIDKCDKNLLSEGISKGKNGKNVTVSYFNKNIYIGNVTKLNN